MRLTGFQRFVLDWMRRYHMRCTRVGHEWVWPEDIRADAELARRV